jgi:hypothetical protein
LETLCVVAAVITALGIMALAIVTLYPACATGGLGTYDG